MKNAKAINQTAVALKDLKKNELIDMVVTMTTIMKVNSANANRYVNMLKGEIDTLRSHKMIVLSHRYGK